MQVVGDDSKDKTASNGARDANREAIALLRGCRMGSLAVVDKGVPRIALVTPAVALDGAPVILLSRLSAHTRAIDRNPHCALMLVGPLPDKEQNPQTAPRLSLVGQAIRADDPCLRARYLSIHPYATEYIDFADFGLFRITITEARYVGGFGRAMSLKPAQLAPEPCIVAAFDAASAALIATLNSTAVKDIDRIAAMGHVEVSGWRIVSIDPDGIDLARAETVLRTNFMHRIRDPAQVANEISRLAAISGRTSRPVSV